MNIWSWLRKARKDLLEEGHIRLVHLLDAIPTWVCNNEDARVDAAMAEALAMIRHLKRPWLEIFVRHWHLQSAIRNRCLINENISEAVSLVEFAHRPENQECPQSVCTIQDLTIAYAQKDGPGYAPERIAVCEDTMARLHPGWTCYECIGSEYIHALLDHGDPQRAQKAYDAQIQASLRHDPFFDPTGYASTVHCDLLLALGQKDKALAAAQAALAGFEREVEDVFDGANSRALHSHRLNLARILALVGRRDEAQKALPDWTQAQRLIDEYPYLAQAIYHIALGDLERDKGRTPRRLLYLATEAENLGMLRHAFNIAHLAFDLVAQGGHRAWAQYVLARMERIVAALDRPLDAPKRLADARERLQKACADQGAIGVQAQDAQTALAEGLRQERPEQRLEAAETILLARPDFIAAHMHRIDALLELQELEAARIAFTVLHRLAPGRVESAEAGMTIADALRRGGDIKALRAFLEPLLAALADQDSGGAFGTDLRASLHMVLARALADAEKWQACGEHLDAVLALNPNSVPAKRQWLRIHCQRKDFDAAYADAKTLLNFEGLPKPTRCSIVAECLSLATALEDAEGVLAYWHELSQLSDLDTPHTPEAWGMCRVQLHATEGALGAERIGPALARICDAHDLDSAGTENVFGRHVVLLPQGADNDFMRFGGAAPAIFSALTLLPRTEDEMAFRIFPIDGLMPPQGWLRQFTDACAQYGAALLDKTPPHYRLRPHVEGGDGVFDEVDGFFGLIAWPQDRSAKDLDELLVRHLRFLQTPLAWVELLEFVGEFERARDQRMVLRHLGL